MEERKKSEDSGRRSSAAITGCQLAKKSNARFPRLCDAMSMACRCLFSTRCLHTWLDPREISEMFLAAIRNHIYAPITLPTISRTHSLHRHLGNGHLLVDIFNEKEILFRE